MNSGKTIVNEDDFEIILSVMKQESSLKKKQKSPNDKLLKSFYSKQKSKS